MTAQPTASGLPLDLEPELTAKGYSQFHQIGAGGMGTIVYARKESLDREVAIKVIAQHAAGDQEEVRRFMAEMRTVAALEHPAIVPIYDGDITPGGVPYFVMKFLSGPSLEALLNRRILEGSKFTVEETVQVLRPIAEALDYLADLPSPVIHRDIKPANIIADDCTVMLADFGIALNGENTRLTREGLRVGTDAYMAPELYPTQLAQQPPQPTAASDRYALALIAMEMLTLVNLRRATSPQQWAHSRVIPQLAAHNLADKDAPRAAALNAFFATALHPDPQARFATSSGMIEALAGVGKVGAGEASPSTASSVPVSAAEGRHSPQRRRLTLLGGALAAVLCLVGITGFLALRGAGWDEEDSTLAQEFPNLLPTHPGRGPWKNLDCRPVEPEEGQRSRILCEGGDLTLVAADFGTEDSRNEILPNVMEELISEACTITSTEIPNQPGTWGVYPTGVSARFAFVLAGPDAEQARLSIPIC
ncbi:serine/threonine-protein kinase [uncultured Corynebacterium sp.]|uniref:serine/threonine-protein kinase n=1 Tax=uncultured Corynebacterium sp. TaxID=159447 RepID=UPI0025E23DA2|nr:serine/threonine-protein kinase [uncultured Corynebacterium sp.]